MGTKWTAAKGGAGCVDQWGITNPRPRVSDCKSETAGFPICQPVGKFQCVLSHRTGSALRHTGDMAVL